MNKWITYNGKTIYFNSKVLVHDIIPAGTFRFKCTRSLRFGSDSYPYSVVDENEHIYDFLFDETYWPYGIVDVFSFPTQEYIDIIGVGDLSTLSSGALEALCIPNLDPVHVYPLQVRSCIPFDISNFTTLQDMFYRSAIEEAPAFDTSHVTKFLNMFGYCSNLKKVPLYDTSSALSVDMMFFECRNVESGALDFYRQMSSQTHQIQYHTQCFTYCGINTVTGAAELAQIPTSWGGTMTE